MTNFKVFAQSFTSNQRIAKVVRSASVDAVLPMVCAELEDAGFYVVDIKPV